MYGPSWPDGGQHDAHGAYDTSPTWSIDGSLNPWSWDGSLTLLSEPTLSGSTLVDQSPVQTPEQEYDRTLARLAVYLDPPTPPGGRSAMDSYAL